MSEILGKLCLEKIILPFCHWFSNIFKYVFLFGVLIKYFLEPGEQ